MTYFPLFRGRSWNKGMRCISFYILNLMMLEQWKYIFCEMVMSFSTFLFQGLQGIPGDRGTPGMQGYKVKSYLGYLFEKYADNFLIVHVENLPLFSMKVFF